MRVTAWHNGSPSRTGAGYGLKVGEADRDRHFDRSWEHAVVELGDEAVEVHTNKPSFWEGTCRELIHRDIGRWLLEHGLAPWPRGKPPKLELEPLGGGRFRLHAIPEQVVAHSLRTLIDRVATGEALWQRDDDGGLPWLNLSSALQFYLPALLRGSYPFWAEESLDGFRTATARKTGDHSAELSGLAQLISDMRWTPFRLALGLDPHANAVAHLACDLGETGPDGLVRTPWPWAEAELAAGDVPARLEQIAWAFSISLPGVDQCAASRGRDDAPPSARRANP